MELKVRKTDLLRELQLFQGIVERKNTIPVLANVLMEADAEELRLLATDLEVSLRSRCAATIATEGAVTVPAKKLYEVVRALPETEILIRQEVKGAVRVAAEKFDSRMQTLPREDFPTLAAAGSAASFTLPREAIREMVSRTQFAITGEDTRYFLNGALFILRPDEMCLVATDGHRLALVSAKREAEEAEEQRVILPKKTLWELSRLLVDGDGDVRFESGENHLFFDVDGRQLVSRVIDAQFPAYDRVDSEAERQGRRIRARPADERDPQGGAAIERPIAGRQVQVRRRHDRHHLQQPPRWARRRRRWPSSTREMRSMSASTRSMSWIS